MYILLDDDINQKYRYTLTTESGEVMTDIDGNPCTREIDFIEWLITIRMRKLNCKYLFIDYLGGVDIPGNVKSYDYFKKISRHLTSYCNREDIMIFTAVQTNRALDEYLTSGDIKPENVDSKFTAEAKSLITQSTIAFSLFRDPENNKEYYINVFKNRNNGNRIGCIKVRTTAYDFRIRSIGIPKEEERSECIEDELSHPGGM